MPEATKSRAEDCESIRDEKQESAEASHLRHDGGDTSPNSNETSGVSLTAGKEGVGLGQSDEIDNPSPS